ncbi:MULTISPECIES: DUF1810 domain-containing protein [unclassified Thiocapsa]|uniref:DUF1810 domain-containing protein n=1 Tax=unclassified Thiocapsa TaxID=2641286 RepID=UPI0035B49C41
MTAEDHHDLNRFVRAQEHAYAPALAEIRSGRKRTHWMWYIFPQLDGLGFSEKARRYAIRGLDEARAYLEHPLLGPRLVECAEAVLAVQGRSAREIFGTPDDLKLRSCSTLFAEVSPEGSVFHRLIEVFFGGAPDGRTLTLLGQATDRA